MKKHYLNNWWVAECPERAYVSFVYAAQMGGHTWTGKCPSRDLIKVAEDALGAQPCPADKAKCVAMALQFNSHYKEAIEVFEAIQHSPEDKLANFEVYGCLGRIYYDIAETIPTVKRLLATWPNCETWNSTGIACRKPSTTSKGPSRPSTAAAKKTTRKWWTSYEYTG
jgi:hypothetical protein